MYNSERASTQWATWICNIKIKLSRLYMIISKIPHISLLLKTNWASSLNSQRKYLKIYNLIHDKIQNTQNKTFENLKMFNRRQISVRLQCWINIISRCRTDTESILHMLMSSGSKPITCKSCIKILIWKYRSVITKYNTRFAGLTPWTDSLIIV